MLRQLCFTNDVTALAVCHATIMFMVMLQNDCTTLGQVFDTVCTVQGFDMATRADVEGSIEANWKKSDLKKEVLACFCFQLLLSTGANWRFYALVSAIVRIYLQGPVDKGNVSLRPPPLVTVFCRPDFKYYIFLFARKRCWLSLWRNCIIKESNTCHILTTFNSFYQYYFCFIKKMGG